MGNSESRSRTDAGAPPWIARTAAVLVFLTGAAVLSGWIFDVPSLKSVVAGWARMAPLTSVCFLLASTALWFEATNQLRPIRFQWLPRAGAAVVILIALIKLTEALTGWDSGIDYMFSNRLSVTPSPARMVEATAMDFLLFGSAMLAMRNPRSRVLFHVLILSGACVAWLGLSRYLFGPDSLTVIRPMAFHSGAAFLLLYTGALSLRGDGLAALFRKQDVGGQTLRRLLVPTLVALCLMSWAEFRAEHAEWFTPGATKALFTTLNLVFFGTLLWSTAAVLSRAESKRRAVEESLYQSLDRTRSIVECSEDAIISKTLEGVVTSWNPGAEKLFGHSAQEIVGKPVLTIIPPDRHGEETAVLQRVARGETVHHFDTIRLRQDGEPVDVSATISPLKDSRGAIIGASMIARDITVRKQEQRRMQAQMARLALLNQITRAIGEHQDLRSIYQVVVRTLEEHLPIDFGCIGLHNPDTHTLTVTCVGVRSEALANTLAMPENATIPIDENGLSRCVRGRLVHEPDLADVNFPFPRRLFSGGLSSLVIAPLSIESKTFGVLVAARKAPNTFTSGECEFLKQLSEHVALASHQTQLYAALQQAYDDLRRTQEVALQQERLRALGQMASGIAHDINNALSPVSLYTTWLSEHETNLSPKGREALTTVEHAVDDIAQTVARLREFCRQGETQLSPEPTDLNSLVKHVVDLSRARWSDMPQQRGILINLKMELEPDLPAILGMPSEIRDALVNLIFNAVDAMPQGGTLTVRTSALAMAPPRPEAPPSRRARLEVMDTGVGMDEDTQRRCLDPFFTTKGERGTGLGLAMVYGMARRHRAELEIESVPGTGTTMRLLFPAPTSAVSVPAERLEEPTLTRPLRILVIDDDPIVLMSLKDILEPDGHTIVASKDSRAGLETFRETAPTREPFEVVITDLGMPHLDGRKVAAGIKAISPSTPVILMTGWGEQLVADEGVPAHVDQVLNKPPKLPDLRKALAAVVK